MFIFTSRFHVKIYFYCYFFEVRYGDELSQAAVEKKIPRKVKKRRKVQTDDGVCFEIDPLYLSSQIVFLSMFS